MRGDLHIANYFFKSYLTILFLFFTFSNVAISQQTTSLNRTYNIELERALYSKGNALHTGIKPYIETFTQSDSILIAEQNSYFKKIRNGYVGKKLFQDHLINVNREELTLSIDPVLNVYAGRNLLDSSNFYSNTRGILVKGKIGNNFTFNTGFAETQSIFPRYIASFVKTYEVVPGQGRAKKFKTTGFDYAIAQGNISYSFLKHYNIQIGHGKNFVGDGYRSLLLSDNAFNYPYARLTANFKKLQYSTIYSSLQLINGGRLDLSNGLTEPLFQKREATFHYLSWNVIPNFTLGFFEGIIWQTRDSINKNINPYTFNPLIYFSALQYGLSAKNNVMAGLTAKLKLFKKAFVYAQFVRDNNYEKKPSFQTGFRAFDLFGLKNFHLQIEYNELNQAAYTNPYNKNGYIHYNQPLAHPMGNSFKETIVIIDYRFYRVFSLQAKYTGATMNNPEIATNLSPLMNYTNLPVLYYGTKGKVDYLQGRGAIIINQRNNLQLFSELAIRRSQSLNLTKYAFFASIGIKTLINDHYFDF